MKTWIVQGATVKTLANIYSVSVRVMKGYIQELEERIGKINGRYLTGKQVAALVEHLGPPPGIEIVYPAIFNREIKKCAKTQMMSFSLENRTKKQAA